MQMVHNMLLLSNTSQMVAFLQLTYAFVKQEAFQFHLKCLCSLLFSQCYTSWSALPAYF